MSTQVPVVLRWLAYLLFASALFPLGLAVREFSRARSAAYYGVRRAALGRASRYLLVAVVPPVLGIVTLILAAQLAPSGSPTATPSPTPSLPPTATLPPATLPVLTPSETVQPTPTSAAAPTLTPTRRPTATPPPIASPTPTVPPPVVVLTPIPSALPAREGAQIELLALASELDSDGQPVDPGKEFAPGQHLVHLFFRFAEMSPGVPVTMAWYRDGELWDICTGTWLWDSVEGRVWGEAGTESVSCQPITGWQPGSYEIRVYIGADLQGIAQFVIE